MEMTEPNLFRDDKNNFYTRQSVVLKDVDTPGPQFSGWVTLASCQNDSCIDNWVRVEPVMGRFIAPSIEPSKSKKLAVVEVMFHGQWTGVHDVMNTRPATDLCEITLFDPINQIRVRYSDHEH